MQPAVHFGKLLPCPGAARVRPHALQGLRIRNSGSASGPMEMLHLPAGKSIAQQLHPSQLPHCMHVPEFYLSTCAITEGLQRSMGKRALGNALAPAQNQGLRKHRHFTSQMGAGGILRVSDRQESCGVNGTLQQKHQ